MDSLASAAKPPPPPPSLFSTRVNVARAFGTLPFFLTAVIARDARANGGVGLTYRLDLVALLFGLMGFILAITRTRPERAASLPRGRRIAIAVALALLGLVQVARGTGLLTVYVYPQGSAAAPGIAKISGSPEEPATLGEASQVGSRLAGDGSPGIATMWKGRVPGIDKEVLVLWMVPTDPTPAGFAAEAEQDFESHRARYDGTPFGMVVLRAVGPKFTLIQAPRRTAVFVRSGPSGWTRSSDADLMARLLASGL
jgi:hypothetical protein